MYLFPLYLVNLFDQFDSRERILESKDTMSDQKVKPTVLIFLPGIHEINRMHKIFTTYWQKM